MSDWISYVAQENGKPYSVKIDLTFQDPKQRSGLAQLVVVRLEGFTVDSRRFPTQKAFTSQLYPFEDAFEKLVHSHGGVLVLTTIDETVAAYAAYLPERADIAEEAAALGERYALGATVHRQMPNDWNEYTAMLPARKTLEEHGDRLVMSELARAGDNATIPRDVEFHLHFPNKSDAQAASAELNELPRPPFEVHAEREVITVACRMPVTLGTVSEVREQLRPTVARHHGKIEGWGCNPETGETRSALQRLKARLQKVFRRPR
jgi:hypothetical protein